MASTPTDAPAASPRTSSRASGHRLRRPKRLWPVIATLALSVSLIVLHPVGLARVTGQTMQPTLMDGSVAVVRARWGWEGGVHRGDVVVFEDPGGWGAAVKQLRGAPRPTSFVKRVIGVGGDTVVCCNAAGRITVDGHPVKESYARPTLTRVDYRVTVPEGYLWVVGDNSGDSLGSRAMRTTPGRGFVPEGAVTGVVLPRP